MTSPSGVATKGYSDHTQFYTQEIPPLLVNYLGRSDWQKFLELGCGDGSLLNALNHEGYFHNKLLCALDASETRITRAMVAGDDSRLMVGDACKTPLKDESFDFLITSQVVEHVYSDEDMVKEMHRVLAPGGMVYLSTVFRKWYGWYFYRCNGRWTLDPTHLREYEQDDQLIDLFQRAGFEVLENRKFLDGRPVLDSVLRRMGASRTVYRNAVLRRLRGFKIPIPGYFIWEIVCQKNGSTTTVGLNES